MPSVSKFLVTDKVVIHQTVDEFKRHLVGMVVMNAQPFRFFSSEHFVGINGELARKLGVSLDKDQERLQKYYFLNSFYS